MKKRKGIGAQRVKHPTPSRVTAVLIGDEEHKRKQKRRKRQVRRVKKRKGIEAQGVKPFTTSQATDAHMGDEE